MSVLQSPEIPRCALSDLVAACGDTPVVAINGARQVGKSTLALQLQRQLGGSYITLDDEAQRAAAGSDPRAFLDRPIDGPLVIDEVQRAPELFRALKAEVDRRRVPGRFVITGSTRLLSAPGFADALVGRVEIVDLWPLAQCEIARTGATAIDQWFREDGAANTTSATTRSEYLDRIVAGGFPEAIARQPARRRPWFESYVKTVVERSRREPPDLAKVAELPRVLRLCAARTGTEINVTRFANELGIAPRVVDGYVATLANLFVTHLVPAWSTNLSKKVVRRPKLFVVDSGLAAHLSGATATRLAEPTSTLGPLVETFVAMEIVRLVGVGEERPSVWHFRDRDGAEVDIVLEHPDGRVVGIEIKASMTVTPDDASGLRFLANRLGTRFHRGYVLSMMPEPTPLGANIHALPIDTLWSA